MSEITTQAKQIKNIVGDQSEPLLQSLVEAQTALQDAHEAKEVYGDQLQMVQMAMEKGLEPTIERSHEVEKEPDYPDLADSFND
tara:strand:- start:35131 stop:35382 length:252 start_codon:yes stop_codon:yes gene_type:complete